MKKFILVLVATFLIIPFFTFGSDLNSYELNLKREDNSSIIYKIEYDGLVPCGRCFAVEGLDQSRPKTDLENIHGCDNNEIFVPCTLCHFFIVFDNIIAFFLLGIIPILAILVITVSGVLMIISSGNPTKTDKAKKTLLYAVIGFFISFVSYMIVTSFLAFFMDWDGWKLDDWWTTGGIRVQHVCEIEIKQFVPNDSWINF